MCVHQPCCAKLCKSCDCTWSMVYLFQKISFVSDFLARCEPNVYGGLISCCFPCRSRFLNKWMCMSLRAWPCVFISCAVPAWQVLYEYTCKCCQQVVFLQSLIESMIRLHRWSLIVACQKDLCRSTTCLSNRIVSSHREGNHCKAHSSCVCFWTLHWYYSTGVIQSVIQRDSI